MDYITTQLEPEGAKEAAQNILYLMKRHKLKPDYLLVTGVSGLLIGPLIAQKRNLPLIVMRREGETRSCHSARKVEAPPSADGEKASYLIIDDFVETGKTVLRILKVMKKEFPDLTCLGICIYDDTSTCARSLEIQQNLKNKIKMEIYTP